MSREIRGIKVLYSEKEIGERILGLAEEINKDYDDEEVTVIGVLKGSFLFMADLVRKLNMPLRCDFLRVASYENDEDTGIIRMEFDITQPIHNQNVLLIEDIVDSGKTLKYLKKHLLQQEPKSVRACSLLFKKGRSADKSGVDYVGFEIPDKFVVGYGLDSLGLYRSLPYIGYFE